MIMVRIQAIIIPHAPMATRGAPIATQARISLDMDVGRSIRWTARLNSRSPMDAVSRDNIAVMGG